MLKRFLEWGAAQSRPRFKAFVEAKRRYETYLANRVRARANPLSPEERRRAKEDPALQEAVSLYKEAIRLSEEEGAGVDVAAAAFQLGILLHLQGEVEDAAVMLKRAMAALEDLPKIERQQQEIRSSCLYHLGLIAWRERHDADEAARLVRAALEIHVVMHDVQGQRMCKDALERLPAAQGQSSG